MLSRLLCAVLVALLASSAARAADIRRVVTGLDANNKAIVQFDDRLPLAPGPYGIAGLNLWITDSSPAPLVFDGDPAKKPIGISPPDNGSKFRVVEFGPLDKATEAKIDPEFLMKTVGDKAPKRGLKVTHPFMHRTRSLDYAVILSGEIDMVLDGASVHLKPGDVVVQQATNHGWVNHGTEPCRILFVLMDSKEP
jgi:mannose-6-phosphate isomerase-like protein (cupin superfamily)